MPAYNFHKEFAPLVENGIKRTTIRRPRKRQTCRGETLYLYTGMRTKACRRLKIVTCAAVLPLRRYGRYEWYWMNSSAGERRRLTLESLTILAWVDGFEGYVAFDAWFERYETPTELVLIRW